MDGLPGYDARPEPAPTDEFSAVVPPANSQLWRELLSSFGNELPDAGSSDDAEAATVLAGNPYDGYAHLVRFSDAPPVFFRSDANVDVLLNEDGADEGLTANLPVADLQPGMVVAFLPGGQRSIRDMLLAIYDERFHLEAKMFAPMWSRAIDNAVSALEWRNG